MISSIAFKLDSRVSRNQNVNVILSPPEEPPEDPDEEAAGEAVPPNESFADLDWQPARIIMTIIESRNNIFAFRFMSWKTPLL
jgi:hypothetical protein